ncbi:MAG: acyl-CoA dehydrogenase family protein, partial [Desulfofustis sp. PB-SRB1]|nr:acyl-CoA dehydrogenase family protein [Desulfofustis sp. PB-SRB1]
MNADTSPHLTDFLDIEADLSDEERLVRQTAREFVNEKVLPVIDAHAQTESFPAQLIPPMGELGF